MRIALLTDGIYPYVIGGMQKHSFSLAALLARNKVHVDIYHPEAGLSRIEFLSCFEPCDAEYIRPYFVKFLPPGKLPGHYIRRSYRYSSAIYDLLKSNPPDFIYSQGFCSLKLLEARHRDKFLVPVGVNLHGLEMFQRAEGLRSRLEQTMLKRPAKKILVKADHVFSLGGRLTEIMIKEGVSEEKIILSPNGISSEWLMEAPAANAGDATRFIYVGRYERRKGVEVIMAALEKLKGRKDFEFHFVGDIPAPLQLNAPGVIYHGSIRDTAKLRKLYAMCDVLVCPSYSEGMPTVILEAMASRLAILATDVGAVGEMVSASNGSFVTPGSTDDLVTAMESFIAMDRNKLASMQEHSFKAVKENFVWEAIVPKLISSVKGILMSKSTDET